MIELRAFIIDKIRDEYDRAPDDYKPGDSWDDGTGRIADAIIAAITERVKERDAETDARREGADELEAAFNHADDLDRELTATREKLVVIMQERDEARRELAELRRG